MPQPLNEDFFRTVFTMRNGHMREIMRITHQEREQDASNIRQLFEALPKGLLSFFGYNEVIENLIVHGRRSFRFSLDSNENYPQDMETLERLLEELVRAWGGCIKYSISDRSGKSGKLCLEAIIGF